MALFEKHDNSKSDEFPSQKPLKQTKKPAASISATLDTRIPTAIERGNTILAICNQPSLLGHTIVIGRVEQFESKVSSTLLSNSDSWI